MNKYHVIRFLSTSLFFFTTICSAQESTPPRTPQTVDRHELTSAYLFKFFQYLEWPNDTKGSFNIAFIGADDALFEASQRASQKIKVNNRNFTVQNIPHIEHIDGKAIHLLYIGEAFANDVALISRAVRKTHTVLVAFENPNRRDLMFNLKRSNINSVTFEVNRSNLVFEQIKVDKKITLMGGTEMDVAQLLREQEDSLYRAKRDLELTSASLTKLEQTFEQKNKLFKETLNRHAEDIEIKEQHIERAQTKLTQLATQLNQSQNELQQNQALLDSRINAIKEKEVQIESLSQEITTNQDILEQQNLELGQKTSTISRQRKTLIIIFGLSSLLLIFLVVIVRIARERSKAIKRVEAEKEKTQSLNRELQSFSYAVSHDLRAPLRAISGFGNALLEDHSDTVDEQGREYIQFMVQSSEEMSELIDGLLILSRCSLGELNIIDINLTNIAHSVAEELIAGNPNAKINIEIEDKLTAQGDPILVKNVLTNLISNAWKYSTDERIPKIVVGSKKDKNRRYFYVKDNGIGFDMAHTERLFQPFQRLHKNQTYEGNGIGLATVKKIMERHGGNVWAESKPNEGSTFFFKFGELN